MIVNNKEKEVLILTSTVLDGLYIVTTSLKCKIDNNKIMRKLFISLMLTLTAFIANAQPSAIAPRDYQQMLKKGEKQIWCLFGNGCKEICTARNQACKIPPASLSFHRRGFQETVFADKYLHAE